MKTITKLAAFFTVAIVAQGYTQTIAPQDTSKTKSNKLLAMPFEDLMNVRVVTPTLSIEKPGKAPATVSVITQEQIRLRGYRNLAQILNDLPGFTVNDKSDPQFYNTVSARGIFRQDHFMILLDGVRISSPTNEPLPILENFPIYLAKQIEVMYGPGSALYGADAMAGVINIITLKPEDGDVLNATLMQGSQGYNNVNASFIKKLANGLNVTVAGQYAYDTQPDFSKIYKDDYDMTSHQTGVFNTPYGTFTSRQPISSNYEAPVKAYNFYSAIDKEGFSFKVLHHYAQVPSSTTLKPTNGIYNKDVFYGQGVTMASAGYATTIGKLKSATTLIGSFYKVNPQSNFRNLYGNMEHGYKFSAGSMMKLRQQFAFSASKRLTFTSGFTYELFQSEPKTPELEHPIDNNGVVEGILLNSSAPNNPSGIEARFFSLLYHNIGTFLQTQYNPSEKLSLTGGVRYDNNSRFGSTVNPRIGAVYNPFERTTIKMLYGTAFWAPSPMVSYESYGSFYTTDSGTTYQSGFWHLPNPNLKPLTSQTVELSVNQRFGKKFGITLSAYESTINNMITNAPDNNNTNLYNNKFQGWNVYYIEVPINEGTQENWGGCITTNAVLNVGMAKLNVWSSASYVEGRVSTETSGISKQVEQPTITPWQFRVGCDGRLGDFHFSARLLRTGDQRMTGFIDSDNPYKRKTISGYALLNASIGYTFKKKATLFINAENALDQRYRNAVDWDASSPTAETFNGSFQNPLRIMTGVKLGF